MVTICDEGRVRSVIYSNQLIAKLVTVEAVITSET